MLQDPRRNENAKYSLNFRPYYKVLLLQMTKEHLAGWESQMGVGRACCLEYKCEWLTDCLLPNWKCSVGVYWHGIIPRRRKKKKETWLHIFFFFKSMLWLLFNFYFFGNKKLTFLFEFVFFIYWSERHFKGIIIIYWCNLIGATCLMAPVKIGFHSLDWFEPRTAYRRGGRKKKKKAR